MGALLGLLVLGYAATADAQILQIQAAQPLPAVESDPRSEMEALYRRIEELERKVADSQVLPLPPTPLPPTPLPPTELPPESIQPESFELLPCTPAEEPTCFFSKCVGYDKGFYVRTCDKNYSLKVNGMIQFRHYADWRDTTMGDDFEQGFVVERAPLIFSGNVISPRLKYWYILQSSRVTGTSFLEEGKMIYTFENGIQFQAGRFRNPAFLREMDVSYARQLAVERSYYNSVFATGVLQGITLSKQNDWLRWIGFLNDGRGSGSSARNKDFYHNNSDMAISLATDIKFFGEWAQYGDFPSWPDEEPALFLGMEMFYENPEMGDDDPANNLNHFISYATDLTYESHGFAAFGSLVARNSMAESQDINQYGALCQASYQVIPNHFEPFARYEYIWFDGFTDVGSRATPVNDSNLNILTAGFNWYFHRHGCKLTIEAIHAFNEVPFASPNVGLLADEAGESGQTVLSSQIQLFF